MKKKKKIITSRLLPSRPDKSDSVSKLQELLIKEEGVEKQSVEKRVLKNEGVGRGC